MGQIRSFNDVVLGIINICICIHVWYMVVFLLFQSGACLYSIDFHLGDTYFFWLLWGGGGEEEELF